MKILFMFLHILSVDRCSPKEGTFIFNVKFHIDEETIDKILFFNSDPKKLSERDNIIKYLNKIVNNFNKEIEQYGVQVKPDYSQLILEELNLKINKQLICNERFSAAVLSRLTSAKLSYPNTTGSGYRIIVMSCLHFNPEQIPFFTIPSFSCGRISTIFSISSYVLKSKIRLMLKNVLAGQIGIGSRINSSVFRYNACRSAKNCVAKNKLYGKFFENVDKIELKHYNDKDL